jgi:hypothetical protein
VRNNLDLALASLADLDGVAKVSGTALDLDAVVEELLESGGVEDLVVDGLRAVDDVLLDLLSARVQYSSAFVLCLSQLSQSSPQQCAERNPSIFSRY